MEIEGKKKITPYGMWRYGNDYFRAADRILILHPDHIFIPYYSLIGQSIELVLKSFLMKNGIEIEKLKKSFGHDLTKLRDEARRHDIESIVELSDTQWEVIHSLNLEYKHKRFHYIQVGQMLVPDIPLVHEATRQLCDALEAYCQESNWEHKKKVRTG